MAREAGTVARITGEPLRAFAWAWKSAFVEEESGGRAVRSNVAIEAKGQGTEKWAEGSWGAIGQ